VTFNFLFTDPRFTLRAYNPDSLITFSVMFIAAFATGTLTSGSESDAPVGPKAHRRKCFGNHQMLQRAKDREEIFAQTPGKCVGF
jgi:two-component system sensor histidine kinase KdpD